MLKRAPKRNIALLCRRGSRWGYSKIWIFRPGFTFFADGGGSIWDYGPFLEKQFHHSAGVGLRIENANAQGLGIIRIDCADDNRAVAIVEDIAYIQTSILFHQGTVGGSK